MSLGGLEDVNQIVYAYNSSLFNTCTEMADPRIMKLHYLRIVGAYICIYILICLIYMRQKSKILADVMFDIV